MSKPKRANEAPVHPDCSAGTPRAICDFFLDYGGEEYICEVYAAYNEHIEDIGVYLLLVDGTKGEAVDEDHLPIWEHAQQKFEDDVI